MHEQYMSSWRIKGEHWTCNQTAHQRPGYQDAHWWVTFCQMDSPLNFHTAKPYDAETLSYAFSTLCSMGNNMRNLEHFNEINDVLFISCHQKS